MPEETGKGNEGYNGIPGISYSVRISLNSKVFSKASIKPPDSERIDITIDELSRYLTESGGSLIDIVKFSKEVEGIKNQTVSGRTKTTEMSLSSGFGYVTYDPGYLWLKPLAFNDLDHVDWNSPVWHRSFISPVMRSKNGYRAIYNEYVIAPDGGLNDAVNPQDYAVAYDLLFLIGRNRSMVFSRGYSLRSFNIGLPPARLVPVAAEENGSRDSPYVPGSFIAVPVLILTRKPSSRKFRRTVTESIILVPTDSDFTNPRKMSAKELYYALEESRFQISGDLIRYLSGDKAIEKELEKFKNDGMKIDDLMWLTFKRIYGALGEKNQNETGNMDNIEMQLSISRSITIALLDDKLKYEDVERFFDGDENYDVENTNASEIRDLVAYHRGFNPQMESVTRPGRSKIKWMSIKSEQIYRNDFMFFNPVNMRYIAILPRESEVFPVSSVKLAFLWGFRISVGISAMKSMIYSFYREIEKKRDAGSIIDVENNLVEDAEEFYDLDVISPSYSMEYDNAKRLSSIDRDYKNLKEKMGALKANILIQEQRRLNSIMVIFTGLVMAATIVAFLKNNVEAALLSFIVVIAFMSFFIVRSSSLMLRLRDKND